MNEFLRLMSKRIGYKKHVIMVIDNAGWHSAKDLIIPSNITLHPLPPYSPELNPIENLWGYMKENILSARVFKDLDAVIKAGCDALTRLTKEVIKSVCHRDWILELSSY